VIGDNDLAMMVDEELATELVNTAVAPTLADRMRGAIWGQFVGDAVCLGTHWIYDLAELAQRCPEGIKGFESPAPGHYHSSRASGDQTHYGDAALVLLESIAALGRFDPTHFGAHFVALMDSTHYSGYRDHATQETLAHYQAFRDAHPAERFDFQQGADDDQGATATRLAPVVVAHYGDERLLEIVTVATRVCQNNERAVAYMRLHARVLAALFDGMDLPHAFDMAARCGEKEGPLGKEASRKVREALEASSCPVIDATRGFGQSCALASSFPGAVQAALAHSDDFVSAILATTRAGGDNAGRAALIGAWLGAALGIQGIPLAWRQRLTAREAIGQSVEAIVSRRTSS
jgi:ADP-ribosylglycohydrolase